MGWFEDKANKMHKKEIKSLRDEMSERSEEYVEEVNNAGFDNIHDYEASVNKRMGMGCGLAILGGVIALAGWLISTFIK